MLYRTVAWEIVKGKEGDDSVSPRAFKRNVVSVIHDNTDDKNPKSYIAISSKAKITETKRLAKMAASQGGYTVKDKPYLELDDIFENGREAREQTGQNSRTIWKIGKASGLVGIPSLSRHETSDDQEGDKPYFEMLDGEQGEDVNVEYAMHFPPPGTGVILSGRPERRKGWNFRVWGFGYELEDVNSTTEIYTSKISGNHRARSSPGNLRRLPAVLSALAFIYLLLASYTAIPVGLSTIQAYYLGFYTSIAMAVLAVVSWVTSPVRRCRRSGIQMPVSLVRLFQRRLRFVWNGATMKLGTSFLMESNVGLADLINVKRDMHVMPNSGGVKIGVDDLGGDVRLPDDMRHKSIVVVGDPGNGKTNVLTWCAGGDMIRSCEGEKHTMVWLETKREGAQRIIAQAEKAGTDYIYIVPGSETGPTIRFLEWNNIISDAGILTEALAASFPKDSVQERSRDIFAAIFGVAAYVWPQQLYSAGDQNRDTTPHMLRTAWILAGGKGRALTKKLISVLVETTEDKPEVAQAVEKMEIYLNYKEKAWEDAMSPVRNKLNRLKTVPVWNHNLNREIYTWRDILSSDKPVIIDLSSYDDPNVEATEGMSDEIIRIMLPTCIYTMWAVARKHCADWGEQGKTVSVYCDEASNFPYTSGKIISDIARRGRSHGISLALGAQGWSELPENTQVAFNAAPNKIFFGTSDKESAVLASTNINNELLPPDAFLGLPPYKAICSLISDGYRITPVHLNTLKESEWDPTDAWKPTPRILSPDYSNFSPDGKGRRSEIGRELREMGLLDDLAEEQRYEKV